MNKKNTLNDLWKNNPPVIRKFLDLIPINEKLCEEVAYILEKAVKAENIQYSAISFRLKTVDSFCEKIKRREYSDPLKDITDIAGVRIVYPYISDLNKLETVIEREFELAEKVDKVGKDVPDRFGYGAVHYLIMIGKKSTGARYDDLKDLICELQVRTILQDAWAFVAHHLSYKKETDIPKKLRRKLNALSGLFETADDQFDRLRIERARYSADVKKRIAEQNDIYLESEINLDNLAEFLKFKLPYREQSGIGEITGLLSGLQRYGYKTLAQLDDILSRSENAIKAFEQKYTPWDEDTGGQSPYTCVGAVRVAMNFNNKVYKKQTNSESRKKQIDEFMHLVK